MPTVAGKRRGMMFAVLLPLWVLRSDYALAAEDAEDPCRSRGVAVVVLLAEHSLLLCSDGKSEKDYAVSLGKAGVGKTSGGDNKTPVGSYHLGVPRASGRFGIFIPVGYPTEEQKRKGYTGQAIGIHGPDRHFTWAGWLNTMIDWTQGCVAVKSDESIGEIAAWVKKRKPRLVHLVDSE
jgi:murein L,D-transpeptidase YafK